MSFSWTPEGQRHCSGHKCIPDFQDPQLDQACQSQVPCEGKWWDWGQKRWAEQTLILPWFTHKTTYKPSIVPWPSASLTLDPGGQIMELLELHTKKEPEPESPLAGTHLQSAVHILDFRWPLYNWFPVDHHIDRCLFQQLTLLTYSSPSPTVHKARWLSQGVRAGLWPLSSLWGDQNPETWPKSHLVREEMSNTNTAEHLKQVLAGGFIKLTFFREKTLLGKMDLSGLQWS